MLFNKYIPSNGLYRKAKNETLEMIADKFNTSISNVILKSVGEHHEGEFVEVLNAKQFCHTVKPLETLKGIASLYGVIEEQIISSNNIKNKRLFIGQKLRF